MKNQKYNQGELAELKVNIDVDLIKNLQIMHENTDMAVEDLVAIAIKRFCSSHADYLGVNLDYP